MKKILIIGATSGIGLALALEAHNRGYIIGATGRRETLLNELKNNLTDRIFTLSFDVTKPDSKHSLLQIIDKMGGMDIVVINAGISNYQGSSVLEMEEKVIDVNVTGFVRMLNTSYEYFKKQGHGHIVGISSVAGLFGWGTSAPYNASKAFISNYMQGYRQKAKRVQADIIITDIKPGFVESEMTDGKENMFWVASAEKAAVQIMNAIEKRKNHAYITKRWRLVGLMLKFLPNYVIDRL